MSDRELVVLGTASQMPTRQRNHNGYLLLWDHDGVLVDPGEGTQRQLLLSGVRTTRITHICLTHLHGDHCLGVPGVLARLSQCQLPGPVFLHFPASGLRYVQHLLTSSIMDLELDLRLDPVWGPGVVVDQARFRLRTEPLDHSVDAMGWRVEDLPRRHLLPNRLRELGLRGSAVQRLVDEGQARVGDRMVQLDDVSEMGEAHSVAFVFDTRWCDGAVALARDADLLVCESTFLDADADLARDYCHLTAKQAGELAAVAGAHRLVLTHFSRRYPDTAPFLSEARQWFDDVVLAEDLMRIPLPRPPRPGSLR